MNHFAFLLYVLIDVGFHRSKAVRARAVNFVSVAVQRNGSCRGELESISLDV